MLDSATKISNNAYDIAKDVTTIGLPAIATLYFGLAQLWGLPAAEEVTGTIALLTTFLGTLLKISTRKYMASDEPYDGDIVISDKPGGGKVFELNLDGDPIHLVDEDAVTFRIKASE